MAHDKFARGVVAAAKELRQWREAYDKFARGVVAAAKELRQWREAYARTEPVRQTAGKYGDFFKGMF